MVYLQETLHFFQLATTVMRVVFWFRTDDIQALGMQVVWLELTIYLLGSLEGVCLYLLWVNFTEKKC